MARTLIVVSLTCIVLVCGCTNVPRTQVVLPAQEVKGFESSSHSLYAASRQGAPIALGQIFLPPEKHHYLTRLEFFGRRSGSVDSHSNVNITLRISPWQEDRLGLPVLWESKPLEIQKTFGQGWLVFDLPRVRLQPGKKYIAWLSVDGVSVKNDENAAIGIVSMGPRTSGPTLYPDKPAPSPSFFLDTLPQPETWISAYPEGTRAFWRATKPQSEISEMSQGPWVVARPGENLHFKMIFED